MIKKIIIATCISLKMGLFAATIDDFRKMGCRSRLSGNNLTEHTLNAFLTHARQFPDPKICNSVSEYVFSTTQEKGQNVTGTTNVVNGKIVVTFTELADYKTFAHEHGHVYVDSHSNNAQLKLNWERINDFGYKEIIEKQWFTNDPRFWSWFWSDSNNDDSAQYGFVTSYANLNVDEDIAETIALIVTKPDSYWRDLFERKSYGHIYKAKMQLLVQFDILSEEWGEALGL